MAVALTIRVGEEEHELLKRAARARSETIGNFVVQASLEEARKVQAGIRDDSPLEAADEVVRLMKAERNAVGQYAAKDGRDALGWLDEPRARRPWRGQLRIKDLAAAKDYLRARKIPVGPGDAVTIDGVELGLGRLTKPMAEDRRRLWRKTYAVLLPDAPAIRAFGRLFAVLREAGLLGTR